MNITISMTYEIGDVLFLEQNNHGGLRKVVITDAIVSMKSRSVLLILSNPVGIAKDTSKYWLYYTSCKQSEEVVKSSIKYWRRGNNWIIPMPKKTRVVGAQYPKNTAKYLTEWVVVKGIVTDSYGLSEEFEEVLDKLSTGQLIVTENKHE